LFAALIRRQVTGVDRLTHHLGGVLPKRRGTLRDVGIPRQDAIMSDAVAAPRSALGAAVQQHGLKAIYGRGEPGLRAFLGLELVPEGPKLRALVGGKHSEDALGRAGFPLMLVRHRAGVVRKGVTSIDLDEVVNDQHPQHPKHVEARVVRMLRQDEDREAEVPGMLRVGFRPAAAGRDRLPVDVLEPIGLDDEFDLSGQPNEGGFRCILWHGDTKSPAPPGCNPGPPSVSAPFPCLLGGIPRISLGRIFSPQ
jgi:hypothetical protein